ncbi:DprA-like DNA processing chain A [Arthrobacter phage GoCrazy]|uniref:DprA-like DNA processing chain A n=1 Tax=Arthrobacter phage KeaneyLin TaxID=2250412 RepID=A0A345KMH5_9CAUD|nr:DprA-like DNA processing chain A [Arthrobacter phage KeaneyLin]AXH44227.1 DprA-like DNA processing chain A [Arthrobacter phage KeaneyLin]QXO13585.1 DprA-like DNA processing chain A [Arthrobacter phage GoCrazy]WBF79136.1 DprA-like DNA processing chain A [Arthrobacter phage Hankly]
MRLLITGSREWTDLEFIRGQLRKIYEAHSDVTLVSGACPRGADRIAEVVGEVEFGFKIERHPAEWEKYGPRSGFKRNAEMVALGADVCFAFIKDESRGATHTAQLAYKNGIKTYVNGKLVE